jgi:hypothetical protein
MKVMQIIDPASGEKSPFVGTYIVSYDPDFHHKTAPDGYGGGQLRVTLDRALARCFNDAGEALEYWRQAPKCSCHSTRPDGKPNRPLTAFTVSISDEDAAPFPTSHDYDDEGNPRRNGVNP